jgi:homoserine O-acetyltransferase
MRSAEPYRSFQTKALKTMRSIQAAFFLILLIMMSAPLQADDLPLVAELSECPLENGETILDCQLAYQTFGSLNEDQTNILLVPTFYTGTIGDLLKYGHIGPGRIADTDKYFIVAVEAFGGRNSSSPSNSTRQEGSAFPVFNIRDMVRAQHRLLSEVLDIRHVHAVVGVSMGGMQAFEWATMYPQFMHKLVSMEATPWTTSYDQLLWSSMILAMDSVTADPASEQQAIRILASLDALSLWTPRHINHLVAVEGVDEFISGLSSRILAEYLPDRRSQTIAMMSHDISSPFENFRSQASTIIKAQTLILVTGSDHTVNPGPSEELAKLIGAQSHVFDLSCGHMSITPDCNQPDFAAMVNEFLAGSSDQGVSNR